MPNMHMGMLNLWMCQPSWIQFDSDGGLKDPYLPASVEKTGQLHGEETDTPLVPWLWELQHTPAQNPHGSFCPAFGHQVGFLLCNTKILSQTFRSVGIAPGTLRYIKVTDYKGVYNSQTEKLVQNLVTED